MGILTPAREYLAALPGLVRLAAPQARTFAIVRCAAGAFPRQVSDGLERRALALGFEKRLHHEFAPDTADFSAVLDLVERAGPDLLLAVGRIRHDVAFAGQLAQRRRPDGRLPGVVAVVAAAIDPFRAALGDAVSGFIGPSQWEPPAGVSSAAADIGADPGTDPAAAAGAGLVDPAADRGGGSFYGPGAAWVMASLLRESRAAGNLAVDYPMAQAYAAGLIAQRCVLEAATLAEDAVWEAAAGLDFSTFYGRFRMDPESGRPVGRATLLIQWQQGRKAIIWPPEREPAALVYPWRGAARESGTSGISGNPP